MGNILIQVNHSTTYPLPTQNISVLQLVEVNILEVVVDVEEIEAVLYQKEVGKVEVGREQKTEVIIRMQKKMILKAMENQKMTILKVFDEMEMGPFLPLICQTSVEWFGQKIQIRKAKAKKQTGFQL